MHDSLYMAFIACLPRKSVGRFMGAMAGWDGSSVISRTAVRAFAAKYGIRLDEAAEPLEAYPNLRSFFVRALKPGVRPVDPDPLAVVSPVDGVVAAHGHLEGSICLQVKGRTYTVEELLGGEREGLPFRNGYFLTIYLSPRHYHRIHSPIQGDLVRYHHIPGQLFPVNAPSVRSVPRLFAVNERVITYVQLNRPGSPEVAVVKVGAIGVGRIRVTCLERVTNQPGQMERQEELHPPLSIGKGEELGAFELGSTVILVFPPSLFEPDPLTIGDEVKMGSRIGRLA